MIKIDVLKDNNIAKKGSNYYNLSTAYRSPSNLYYLSRINASLFSSSFPETMRYHKESILRYMYFKINLKAKQTKDHLHKIFAFTKRR